MTTDGTVPTETAVFTNSENNNWKKKKADNVVGRVTDIGENSLHLEYLGNVILYLCATANRC